MMHVFEAILTILQVVAITTLIWSALAVVGWLLFGFGPRPNESRVQSLQSEIYGRQLARRDRLISIAQQIRSMPTCSDGTQSDAQAYLQDEFNMLNAEDERLKAQERSVIAEAIGYVD